MVHVDKRKIQRGTHEKMWNISELDGLGIFVLTVPDPRISSDLLEIEGDILCPECGSAKHFKDYKRGEIVCKSCGLVIEERITDLGPDWRGFDTEQRLARQHNGPPSTYLFHDKGLTTMIDTSDYDSRGSKLSPRSKTRIHRLRKWDRRFKTSSHVERNLSLSLSELDRVANQLDLARNVREGASMIYRNVVENGLTRGRSTECSTASAIYISCRQFGVPRTLEEIAGVTKHKKKEIGKSYRLIARGLGIHLPPVNAIDYVPRFTSQLGLPGTIGARAIGILRQIIEDGMSSGKGPAGIAAAAIYTACIQEDENRTQRDISNVTGVTEVTVRNRYKDIAEYLNQDVEPEIPFTAE